MDQQPPANQPGEATADPTATPAAKPAEAAIRQTPDSATAARARPAGETATASMAGSATPAAAPEEPTLVTIDQFGSLDLRVAVVLGYERVAGTDRLLKLDIDLGSERRTIVSGIAHLTDPDSLVGQRIIVVANLQPARIRGVESRGMLLAAGGRTPEQAFGLATVPDTIAAGTKVS